MSQHRIDLTSLQGSYMRSDENGPQEQLDIENKNAFPLQIMNRNKSQGLTNTISFCHGIDPRFDQLMSRCSSKISPNPSNVDTQKMSKQCTETSISDLKLSSDASLLSRNQPSNQVDSTETTFTSKMIRRIRSAWNEPCDRRWACPFMLICILCVASIVVPIVLLVGLPKERATTLAATTITETTVTTLTTTTTTTATTATTTSSTSTTSTTTVTTTTTTSTETTTTTATTTTTTTATTTTTTTTTTATTTTATTATTTSSTSTTSTTTVTTTTTTATTTTSVTTSSTSETTSTSSTSTSTTTSTTTTTAFNSCTDLQWNQTGVIVAGTGSNTANSNGFRLPSWLYVDANGTLYVCDQQNNRVQMWTNGAVNGTTVAGDSSGAQGSTSILLRQPSTLTFDNNGFLYVSDQQNNRVQRYPPNSLNGTMVAGQGGGGSNALNDLKNPSGIAVDNNSNLYIADANNNRLVVWAPNATTGTILISDILIGQVYGLLLAPGSSNQVYLSNQGQHSIYLWTFGASTPNITLTQVSGIPNTLNNPSGISLDPYGNLYVADKDNNRVVMYCVNSTVGITVINGSTPALNHPIGVGFDSNLNMYVGTHEGDNVVRYALL